MAGADSATQSGAQNRDGGYVNESEDRELTPREEALRAIAAKRMGVLASEIVEGGGADPQFGNDPDDAAAEDDDADARRRGARTPVPALLKSAPAAAPAVSNVDDQISRQVGDAMRFSGDLTKTTITVKVDGEEMELPLDRVVANYQKTAAADRRLEEATRLRREAQELTTSGGAPAAPAAAPGPAAAPASVDPDAFTSALFEGDTAQAGTALQALIDAGVAKALEGRGNATPVDVAEVTNSVKQQIEWDQKWMASKERYPVMYDDPDVHAVAASKMRARIDEGMSPEQALDEVEASMAKSFGWKSAATGRANPKPTPRVLDDRLERKRQQISPTPAASVRRGESQEDAEPLMDARDRAVRGIEFLRQSRPGQTADA